MLISEELFLSTKKMCVHLFAYYMFVCTDSWPSVSARVLALESLKQFDLVYLR